MNEKFKPRTFPVNAADNQKRDVFIKNLPDGDYECVVQEREHGRGNAQNRLMWLWNGQIGQSMGVSPDYAHGLCKLDVGLPFMLADESLYKRAAFVQEVLDHVIQRKHKVLAAYDMVRTKDLTIKQFAAYLTAVDRHFADQGIVLVSPDDLRNQALYSSREAQAA